MQAYHFNNGRTLRNGRPLPAIGETLIHDGEVIPCQLGLHGCEHPFDAFTYALGLTLDRVILGGNIVPHGDPVDKYAASERTRTATIDATPLVVKFTGWCSNRAARNVANAARNAARIAADAARNVDSAADAADAAYTARIAADAARNVDSAADAARIAAYMARNVANAARNVANAARIAANAASAADAADAAYTARNAADTARIAAYMARNAADADRNTAYEVERQLQRDYFLAMVEDAFENTR